MYSYQQDAKKVFWRNVCFSPKYPLHWPMFFPPLVYKDSRESAPKRIYVLSNSQAKRESFFFLALLKYVPFGRYGPQASHPAAAIGL
jgi:hypothetical protein